MNLIKRIFKKFKTTHKEISVLISIRYPNGTILTQRKKLGFNDNIEIKPNGGCTIMSVHISSFEYL